MSDGDSFLKEVSGISPVSGIASVKFSWDKSALYLLKERSKQLQFLQEAPKVCPIKALPN